MGNGSFPGVKLMGCGVNHSPLSSAEVKERVELYLYSLSLSLSVVAWFKKRKQFVHVLSYITPVHPILFLENPL